MTIEDLKKSKLGREIVAYLEYLHNGGETEDT